MAMKFSTALRTARASTINTEIGASALIRIYDGTQPAGPDTAVTTQVLLAQFTCDATAFGAASGGVLTIDADPDLTTTAEAGIGTRTATWARVLDSTGTTAYIDGDVSTTGAFLNLNNTSITELGTVTITSGTITEGNA